ncbi:type VI secretion system tip protein TssI/VgrG [Leisingera sp. SS27]|uniref:type VI secretion system Vgr family protein n=1 Tax=Leisingera sp. SS27 TaxID=2979462 RepID=UPI00232B8685|nr:type VI secretion system tip protein TssI/VgrG [Leisingera sp. SS27]MDC0660904.1 type VI secretion system tip protein TssI/VgrG [Leisingera sp. SS27]
MNTHFSQQDRQGRLSTVLGADSLVLLRMDGSEELSGDFEWRVEALSAKDGLDLTALLGTHATVEIDHGKGSRAFDGIVCEARQRGAYENGFRYDLLLRPWLHVAGLRRNMRIFHNKTVITIIEEVLSAYAGLGNPHLEVQVSEDYPVLEYTVQYGESDADFVRRQLERHGISWSWRHESGSHTMLLADAAFSLPQVPDGSRHYYGVAGYHRHEEEHFRSWSPAQRITTGAVRLTEYNFKIPMAAQEAEQLSEVSHPSSDIESYDWPGDYLTQGEGRGVADRRLEEERGQVLRHHAEGDVVSLGAGWRVTLAGDEVPGATGQTFVCLKATHRFRAQAYGSGDASGDEAPYEGSYVLTPETAPFRPERRTKGPRVQGPETAVVVGEGEIDCDEHGRILVRFHWDWEKAHTMRVRVSQNWASQGWGGMVIPRIGMEVIVEHLRGDPDKPIVTGCVYNGKNKPPYELPKHKTRSTFKTDTHKGRGFNELRFEDEKGLEEIRVHAEKDLNTIVGQDEAKLVMRNYSEMVRDNRLEETVGDAYHSVAGTLTFSVGNNGFVATNAMGLGMQTNKVSAAGSRLGKLENLGQRDGSFVLSCDGDKSETVQGNSVEIVSRQKISTVDGLQRQEITGNLDMTVGASFHTLVRGRKNDIVDKKYTLTCGQSSITLEPNGKILIRGIDVQIEGSSSVKITGGRIDLN